MPGLQSLFTHPIVLEHKKKWGPDAHSPSPLTLPYIFGAAFIVDEFERLFAESLYWTVVCETLRLLSSAYPGRTNWRDIFSAKLVWPPQHEAYSSVFYIDYALGTQYPYEYSVCGDPNVRQLLPGTVLCVN
jgi:hypothetical protein